MNLPSQKQQAWALFNEGQLDDARQFCEELCDVNSADAEMFYLLGSCHARLGRYKDAVAAFHNSLRAQPGTPSCLLALGGALNRLGRLEDAAECFRSVLVAKPKMVEAHCMLADVLAMLGFTVDAREHYELARDLRPDMGGPHIGLGTLAGNRGGNHKKALVHYQAAVDREPEIPGYRCALGMALAEVRRYEEARAHYQEALRIAPGFPDAIAGTARLFNLEGEYGKALEQIELLRNKKIYNLTAAIAYTSICRHSGDCTKAVEYAEKVLESKRLTRKSLGSLHMHTARALDLMDRYDEAWKHFEVGNKLSEGLYDTAVHRLRTDKMIEVFSQAGLLRLPRSSLNSKRPIFIVGMPRSGSSLVEQIMAAHPSVSGGGELTYISDMVMGLHQDIGSEQAWPGCAHQLKQDDLNRLARRYLDQLDGISRTAARVTDKMPHNFYALGFIQLLFPKAQIIHCKRDPMDTCLSIYFQNFFDGHEYARNLYHIGTHYHQYQRLMEHWRHYLSIPVLDVQYEDLVRDPEPAVRRMLEHCGLEWHEGCLQFHKVKRSVSTASFDQVRQPMYTRSVGRWRHYEDYLGDLKSGLESGF
ncbi:sulfotransferase [Pseudomonadota bacterium]